MHVLFEVSLKKRNFFFLSVVGRFLGRPNFFGQTFQTRKKKWPFFNFSRKKKVFEKLFFKHDPSSKMHWAIIFLVRAFKRYRVNTVGGSYGFDRKIKQYWAQKRAFLGPIWVKNHLEGSPKEGKIKNSLKKMSDIFFSVQGGTVFGGPNFGRPFGFFGFWCVSGVPCQVWHGPTVSPYLQNSVVLNLCSVCVCASFLNLVWIHGHGFEKGPSVGPGKTQLF